MPTAATARELAIEKIELVNGQLVVFGIEVGPAGAMTPGAAHALRQALMTFIEDIRRGREGETMGWASGSEIAIKIVEGVRKSVNDFNVRKKIYKHVIEALDAHDWDTQDEVMGIDKAFDDVMREMNPDMEG